MTVAITTTACGSLSGLASPSTLTSAGFAGQPRNLALAGASSPPTFGSNVGDYVPLVQSPLEPTTNFEEAQETEATQYEIQTQPQQGLLIRSPIRQQWLRLDWWQPLGPHHPGRCRRWLPLRHHPSPLHGADQGQGAHRPNLPRVAQQESLLYRKLKVCGLSVFVVCVCAG